MIIRDNELGRIGVNTIPIPEDIRVLTAHYSFTGKIILLYRTGKEANEDYYHIALINDDGDGFKKIFSGEIKVSKKSNGIRILPFTDNRRILLGDYVLECFPDIDNCQYSKLLPLEYPWFITRDPRTFKYYSEPIISPDGKHIAWTTLRIQGAINFLGVLKRKKNKYKIENIQVISDLESFDKEKEDERYIIPRKIRGGEVKQFIDGGKAISLAGFDAWVQDLETGKIIKITNTPWYDETVIFSPDEKLGMVMTTRGSPKTSCSIFALLPRPYLLLAISPIIFHIYMYSIVGVRTIRKGNIGPAIIEIEKSMKDKNYMGVLLNDPKEEWVYISPMSWHPSGKRALFLEMLRGEIDKKGRPLKVRLRRVDLYDYIPSNLVLPSQTPNNIPYAIKGIKMVWKVLTYRNKRMEGKIRGRYSGYINYSNKMSFRLNIIEFRYNNFSDDGKNFYNGYEKTVFSPSDETVYEADLKLVGEENGEMRLKVTFSKLFGEEPVRIIFDKDINGNPKSYGYVKYKDVILKVEDLLP